MTDTVKAHRAEGIAKVTGAARYAYEHPVPDAAYAYPVQAPIASGIIGSLDAAAALAMPGVIAVLWGGNTNPLWGGDFELSLFNRSEVTYRGQLVAAVIADTLENARAAAAAVHVDYQPSEHDVVLRADHPGLYRPEKVNPALPTDFGYGDVAAGLAGAAARVAVTYTTPVQHNNAMEPHAAVASWDEGGALTVYDSTQGPAADRDTIAGVLGLDPAQVRVVSPHVGGGFGSKGTTRPHAILAAIAARAVGRPVKVALTRQQMFTLTGHRTPTIQRMELGAAPRRRPSTATAAAVDGGYEVRIAAADIGTGARTVLGELAASVLGVDPVLVRVKLGDSALPDAPLAGGSMGTASWGSAVAAACEALLKDGQYGSADTSADVAQDTGWARHSFGAQFAEVLVDPLTGEVRVPRLLGVFAAGRILNPVLARSQFIGGMTMGLSMALFEETAAIGNAVWHATGRRVRDLPITPAKLLR